MKNKLHSLLAALLTLALLLACLPMSLAEDIAPEPTSEPTPEPTSEPTPEPTSEPTPEPTTEPSPAAELTDEQMAALESIPEGFDVEAVAEAMLLSSGCPHTRLEILEHMDYASQNYTPIDLTWHNYSYRITGRTLECWECRKAFQTISINETVNEKQRHGWVIDKVSSKISIHCIDCDMTQKVTPPCKHSGSYSIGEDNNLYCSKCGATIVLNTLQTYCDHSNRSVYYPNVAYTTCSRWDAQQHVKLSSIPVYDDLSDGIDATCNDCGEWLVCNLDGSIDYCGNTDRVSWKSRDSYTLEPHSFKNGVCACGYVDSQSLDVITLSGSHQLVAGKSAALKACDITGKAISAKNLKWTTSDKAVLTVSDSGRLTAKKAGTATVTATAKDGKFGTLEITVLPKATGVKLSLNGIAAGKTIAVDVGETGTLQLGASVSPEAAMQDVSWKSSSTKVARVDAYGNVTLFKTGSVTITATAKDGSGKNASVQLKLGRLVKSLEITGATELTSGKSTTLKATAYPANATNRAVSWTSSNPAVASVSSSGKVTAKKLASRQSVTITATAKDGSGVTASHTINLCPAAGSVQLSINGAAVKSAKAAVGSTVQLNADVYPADASQLVKWASSNKKVARVDASGLVTPVKPGSATITATTANGKKASLKLSVTKALPAPTVTPTPSPAPTATPTAAPAAGDFKYRISGGKCIITGYSGTASSVTIPSMIEGCPVIEIADEAFSFCYNLTSVSIPNSVARIGAYAFDRCYQLTSIRLPGGLRSIGEWAFSGCGGLSRIDLPDGLLSIETYAFAGCKNLTAITIPASVTGIGVFAFSGCNSLTIYGETGSSAESHARLFGISFVPAAR